MRSKFFFLGAVSLLLASCSSELDLPVNEALEGGDKVPLSVTVSEKPYTKALGQVTGTSFSGGAKVGVFVTGEDGGSYDGRIYNNLLLTNTETPGYIGNAWSFMGSPVLLSTSKAKVYAYYPHRDAEVSLNSITISNDNVDWMYTPTPATDVSMLNPTASLSMEHAMTIINVKILASNSASTGTIKKLTLDGTGWATSAKLDLQNGTIGSYEGVGAQLLLENLGDLSTSGTTESFWVVSNMTPSVIKFEIMVDNRMFTITTPSEFTLQRGKAYTFTLNVEDPVSASVSKISMTNWVSEAVNYDTTRKTIVTLEEAKTMYGVYGMLSDGRLMVYDEARSTTETLTKAILVVGGNAYQIAKVDATGYNGAKKVCWDKNDNTDIADLANNTMAYNGQANTAIILAAQSNGTEDYTIGKAVMDFRNNSTYNEGYTDWFVPSSYELRSIRDNKAALNTLLSKIGGTAFVDAYYWSSTEYSALWANDVSFSSGSSYDYKYYEEYVRLVRLL